MKFSKNMPYIADKTMFKAVCFVRYLINESDVPIELAIYKSAKYYKVNQKKLAQEMGRLGSACREMRK